MNLSHLEYARTMICFPLFVLDLTTTTTITTTTTTSTTGHVSSLDSQHACPRSSAFASNEPKYTTEPKYGQSLSPDNKSWESFPQAHSEYGSEYGRNSPPQDYYQHADPFAGQRLPPPGANIDFNNRYHS